MIGSVSACVMPQTCRRRVQLTSPRSRAASCAAWSARLASRAFSGHSGFFDPGSLTTIANPAPAAALATLARTSPSPEGTAPKIALKVSLAIISVLTVCAQLQHVLDRGSDVRIRREANEGEPFIVSERRDQHPFSRV